MDSLVRKLGKLKKVVVEWEKERKQEQNEELVALEIEFENISGFF